MPRKISLFSLVVLMVAAIDNIRNLPAAALFGSSLIFFFILSALIFLIPTSLVAAELSAAFPNQGGVYHWVHRAFGSKWAMAAIWLQWINTLVWFPTMLSFIAGTLAYLIYPELAENKLYLISCILIVFWGLTFLNLKGIHLSAILNNLFALVGTIFPMILLMVMGACWVFSGQELQINLSWSDSIPSFSESTSWISLIAIMASFLGMELSGVHVNDIENPQKNFPRAVFVATLFIFLSMVLGSLSIAFVLPEQQINLVSGVMQVFSNFFTVFKMEGFTPILTVLIVAGSIGTMINWLISPAKGLLHAAEFGYLPSFFTKTNSEGVPVNILLTQAAFVTLLCLVFLFESSVNGFYWFFTALSTELYMVMYVLMFFAFIKLHYTIPKDACTFRIPGKTVGMWFTVIAGLLGCITTIVISFFPPDNIDVGGSLRYMVMIVLGNLLTISPLFLLFLYRKRKVAHVQSFQQ